MASIAIIMPAEGYRIDDFMAAASRLGHRVVVVTDANHSLAEDMGASLVPVDFRDEHEAAVRLAGASAGYDAIVPIDDRGVRIAAKAAELRGIPHNPMHAAFSARDKSIARHRLAGSVRQPEFRVIQSGADAPALAAEVGYPLVAKPVGLAGSIGVIRVDDEEVLESSLDRIRAIQAAHGYPQDHALLVESFIEGDEVSIEGLLHEGSWRTLAVFDKPDTANGPYFPETYFVTPSRHPEQEAIERSAEAAAARLGLVDGPVHAEFRLSPEPVLIELAARTIGGLCGRALRFGLTDTALEELVLRNALGEEVRGTSMSPGASGVAMIGPPRSGRFAGMQGLPEAAEVPGITEIEVAARSGSEVAALPDDSVYLGFVFARASQPDAVEAALRAAVGRLTVDID